MFFHNSLHCTTLWNLAKTTGHISVATIQAELSGGKKGVAAFNTQLVATNNSITY